MFALENIFLLVLFRCVRTSKIDFILILSPLFLQVSRIVTDYTQLHLQHLTIFTTPTSLNTSISLTILTTTLTIQNYTLAALTGATAQYTDDTYCADYMNNTSYADYTDYTDYTTTMITPPTLPICWLHWLALLHQLH